MKLTRLRLLGAIVAVLVLGTVAFAVAVGAQAPAASQIPTVVTHQVTATPAPQTLVATVTPSPSTVATKPVTTKPSSAKPNSGAEATDHSSPSQREVVTPKLRDDGDGDESGSGKSDGDSDDSGSSGAKDKTSSASGSSAKGSSSGNRGTESSAGGAKGQESKSTRFATASSGVGVRASHVTRVTRTLRTPGSHRSQRIVRFRAAAHVRAHRSSGKNVLASFRN